MVQFIKLGRGNKLNISLVDKIIVSKEGRYFIKDMYNCSYEVDRKHYLEIIKIFNMKDAKEIK